MQQYEELDEAHRERETKVKALEWEKHNLEIMNSAAIDRELKMVELKERIKELEKRGSNADQKR